MTERPVWSVEAFVRARRAFDEGRGPAEAWTRLNEISLHRLHELSQHDGVQAWAIIIGPYDVRRDVKAQQQEALVHTVKSMGYPVSRCAMHWRFEEDRVDVSAAVVVPRLAATLAEHVARRREQLVIVQVTAAPSEIVEVVNVATSQRVRFGVFDPAGIADAIIRLCGAAAVAFQYTPVGWFEGLAVYVAERRLRSTGSRSSRP